MNREKLNRRELTIRSRLEAPVDVASRARQGVRVEVLVVSAGGRCPVLEHIIVHVNRARE